MAKYQKYAEYKDSGVEWLGEIPSHWNVSKIGFHTSKIGSGKTPKGGAEVYKDEGILFLRSQNIYNDGLKIDASESVYITQAIHDDMSTSKVDPGDILLNITGGSIGRSCLVPPSYPEANVNQHVCIIRVRNPLNKFLAQVIKADLIQAQIRLIQTGGNREGLNFEQISKFVFILPPSEEQQLIIKFLDHETAKIDTLIAKQEKLIELLKEKRQAVISHAVTKGLNPNVAMKDSGVEWLGEVPEHWTVSRYKYTTERVIVGIAEAATHAYSETGIPIIRSTNIKEDGLMIENVLYIKQSFADANSSKYIYENDIVTVRTGYPGISSVVPKEMNKSHCFTNLVSTPKKAFDPNFLNEYLNSELGKSYFDLLGWGSAQKNISVPILQEFPIAFPDYREQVEIIKNIKHQRLSFTKLISKAEQNIQLMQERRTALISAAVTGKIDVRHWQHPNQKNNNNTELSA